MYVCMYVCCLHFQIFETTGPIKTKFHVEPPWDRGTNVCSNGPGHMTKMVAVPIYGKKINNSYFPEPKGL